jgi:WD40 repeat protein
LTGSCNITDCKFAHILKLHASIDATSPKPPSSPNNDRRYNNNEGPSKQPVSSIAIWETGGAIKIFTGSHDGKWRLWNTQTFVKEFEHEIGKVECVEVASNYLFCGFEATPISMPSTKVGMIHAWNLAHPTQPPLEFHIQTPLLPYAHNQNVTCLTVEGDKIVSGSRDGSIRLWTFCGNGFLLKNTIAGHASEVTGLQFVDNHLWSSSVDRCIRLWNILDGTTGTGECIHAIHDHSSAVTGLLKFTSPGGGAGGQCFVLSSSLDGSIKAWNGKNGECVASETHGDGVVSMALAADQKNNPILLVGLESGAIMGRNVVQTPKTPAFCLLFKLKQKFSVGHEGAVKAIREGPASTFYTGGDDGKLLVWQITGDLGI